MKLLHFRTGFSRRKIFSIYLIHFICFRAVIGIHNENFGWFVGGKNVNYE